MRTIWRAVERQWFDHAIGAGADLFSSAARQRSRRVEPLGGRVEPDDPCQQSVPIGLPVSGGCSRGPDPRRRSEGSSVCRLGDPCSVAGAGPLDPAIDAVARGSFRHKAPSDIRGSGWVVESLEAALWAFHSSASFSEAVLKAVNLGDDADTTGAVCGQLAGAYWGESRIPEGWRNELAGRELIETALDGLLHTAD